MGSTILFFSFVLTLTLISICTVYLWQKFVIGRMVAGQEILPHRGNPTAPLGLVDVAIIFLVWLILQSIVFSLDANLSKPNDDIGFSKSATNPISFPTRQLILLGMAQIVATFIGAGFLLYRYLSGHLLGFFTTDRSADIKLGFTSFLIVIPPILVVQFFLTKWAPYEHPTLESLKNNPDWAMIAACWFTAVLVAPFCEEFFFRGVLQQWLKSTFPIGKVSLEQALNGGLPQVFQNEQEQTAVRIAVCSENREPINWQAVVFSSAAFAAVHIGQGPAPIPLFFLGLALGYIFEKTNSLLPCVLLHMGLNGFTMFWFTLNILLEPKTIG